MKPVYLCGLLLGGLLLSCDNPAVREQADTTHSPVKNQTNMSSTEKNKATIRSIYEDCLNKRDYNLSEKLIGDEYTGPTREKGNAGFLATVQPIIRAFPDIQWTVEDLFAEDDKVVVRWSWTGTHKEAFRNFPATGKAMTNHAIAIYQLKDGKVINAWMESDRLGFLQQLGIVSPDVFGK